MKASTGSLEADDVPFGRTMFKFKQSSDVTVTLDKPSGARDPPGCGQAGPYDPASITDPEAGVYATGGLNRFCPEVS